MGAVTLFDNRFMSGDGRDEGDFRGAGAGRSFASFVNVVKFELAFAAKGDVLEGELLAAGGEEVFQAAVAPSLVLLTVPNNARGDGPRLLLLLLLLRGLVLLVLVRGVLPAELLGVVSSIRLRDVVLRAHGLPDGGGVVDAFFK